MTFYYLKFKLFLYKLPCLDISTRYNDIDPNRDNGRYSRERARFKDVKAKKDYIRTVAQLKPVFKLAEFSEIHSVASKTLKGPQAFIS